MKICTLEEWNSSFERYIVKDFKKYNDSRPKHMRFMNRQQLDNYTDQVKASNGFKVGSFPGYMTGKIRPVTTKFHWEMAELMAKYAADYYKKEVEHSPLKSVKLIKANKQFVSGIMYYITFTAVDSALFEATYQAKMWRKPGVEVRIEGEFFAKVAGSDKYVGNVKGTRSSSSVAATRAYHGFVRSIRDKKGITYAKARREGSRLWKDMTEIEKSRFGSDAESKASASRTVVHAGEDINLVAAV